MFAPLSNTGWSVFYIFLGVVNTLLLCIPLTLISEALVLRWYQSKSETPLKFWSALKASFFTNAVSGIVGFIALIFLGPLLGSYWQPDAPSTPAMAVELVLALLLTSFLSVFIEYFPLLLFVKGKRALMASLWANSASFVISVLMAMIALFAL
jgi:hypothetical protein